MTENKLLKRIDAYFNLNAKRRRKKAKELKAIIGKLKKKEKALTAEYRKTDNAKQRETLKKRCLILHAKRKKGLKALKKINKE